MQKNNKTLIFKILSSSLSIISVFLFLEIYVRITIDDGLNLDIEMLKYKKMTNYQKVSNIELNYEKIFSRDKSRLKIKKNRNQRRLC